MHTSRLAAQMMDAMCGLYRWSGWSGAGGGEGEQEVEKLARGRQRKDTVKEKPGEM